MSRTTLRKGEKRIDFYPTPPWCVHRLLERCQLPGYRWLEPAAGELAIVNAVNAVRPGIVWTTVEVRKECQVDLVADFTWWGCPELDELQPVGGWDVVITNPPFSQALAFAEQALRRGRTAALLLRVDWLGSQDRWQFHQDHPADLYVLPDRPSFDTEGSDSSEYAWFVWGPGRGGHYKVLNLTPKAVRLEQRDAMRALMVKSDLPLFAEC